MTKRTDRPQYLMASEIKLLNDKNKKKERKKRGEPSTRTQTQHTRSLHLRDTQSAVVWGECGGHVSLVMRQPEQ